MELANAFEPVQDGRLYIEKINGPFLYQLEGTAAEYKAGLDRAIARGRLLSPVRSVIALTASPICPRGLPRRRGRKPPRC